MTRRCTADAIRQGCRVHRERETTMPNGYRLWPHRWPKRRVTGMSAAPAATCRKVRTISGRPPKSMLCRLQVSPSPQQQQVVDRLHGRRTQTAPTAARWSPHCSGARTGSAPSRCRPWPRAPGLSPLPPSRPPRGSRRRGSAARCRPASLQHLTLPLPHRLWTGKAATDRLRCLALSKCLRACRRGRVLGGRDLRWGTITLRLGGC